MGITKLSITKKKGVRYSATAAALSREAKLCLREGELVAGKIHVWILALLALVVALIGPLGLLRAQQKAPASAAKVADGSGERIAGADREAGNWMTHGR